MKTFIYHTPHSKLTAKHRCTIVGTLDPNGKIMGIGISRCSKKDNFSRKLGRIIAEGRSLKESSKYVNLNVQNQDPKKVFSTFVEKLASKLENGQEWVKKLG